MGNDGTATVDLSGGFPTYTVEWNTIPVQNGPTATGLTPGTYEVTVDDLNAGWDGITPGGSKAEEGVYFYRYSATGLDGSEWVGHGFFSLVR